MIYPPAEAKSTPAVHTSSRHVQSKRVSANGLRVGVKEGYVGERGGQHSRGGERIKNSHIGARNFQVKILGAMDVD